MKRLSPEPQIRPARLDRPVGRATVPGYSDPQLEELILRTREEAKQAGRAAGYAVGWAEGRRKAEADAAAARQQAAEQLRRDREALAQRNQSLISALSAAVQQNQRPEAQQWHDVADEVVAGVIHLTQAILGRELRTMQPEVIEAVKVALVAMGSVEQALIRVNPADVELLSAVALPTNTSLVGDPTVPPGGVEVATPAQRVRYHLPSAVEAAVEALQS